MTQKLILLVEDNADDEMLTLRAFKKNGIANDLVVARDGAEALEYLFGKDAEGQPNPLPQIILLDLNLPRIGGLEVLRRIRGDERTKLISVVVLTSSKEDEDILSSYTLGANAYVRKPVEFAAFNEAVRTLGMFWLLLNQAPAAPRPSR